MDAEPGQVSQSRPGSGRSPTKRHLLHPQAARSSLQRQEPHPPKRAHKIHKTLTRRSRKRVELLRQACPPMVEFTAVCWVTVTSIQGRVVFEYGQGSLIWAIRIGVRVLALYGTLKPSIMIFCLSWPLPHGSCKDSVGRSEERPDTCPWLKLRQPSMKFSRLWHLL